MTTQQIKSEIKNVLDKVPESVLNDILDYLRGYHDNTKDQIEMTRRLKKILTEDKNLLEKLAQ